ERNELATEPEAELAELTSMYTERGVPEDDARTVARILSANHDLALDTHARLELGIDPNQQASPTVAAVSSFAAFSIGAIIPLLPWFFSKGLTAVLLSIALGAAGALVLGGLIGSSTGRGVLRTALRQLAAVTVAAGITYGVGSLFGVGTT
ncbi:MAG: VIT1/CCC1 transporter family protein, partial [Acidimicrobiaceae bacterium]|nr:VIT1/CCC1 transporter family protein [Acidimicrobiaceae bacterium]